MEKKGDKDMTGHFDKNLMSAYMDGELDKTKMTQLEETIDISQEARDFLITSVKAHAWIRSDMNQILEEEIPERLLAPFESKLDDQKGHKSLYMIITRMAAAIIILITGIFTGKQIYPQKKIQPFSSDLLAPYQKLVNETLEYNLSGIQKSEQLPNKDITISVTPLRTFRHQDGGYYREFNIGITEKGKSVFIKGLAHRSAKKQWNPKTIFL